MPTILYDEVCNLCNSWINFVNRHDKDSKFTFVALQSDEGKMLYAQHGLTAYPLLSSMILIHKRQAYRRSRAALEIYKLIGLPWSCLYIFRLVPAILRDKLYDYIARNRYIWFGKKS